MDPDQPDPVPDDENDGGVNDNDPQQKASLSRDDDDNETDGWQPFTAKSDAEWNQRAFEINDRDGKGNIWMSERVYLPACEVVAYWERKQPWKAAGMTKRVWIENHNPLETFRSATQWNWLLNKLYPIRLMWPKAKREFLTRNDTSWQPKHSSSVLWTVDIIRDHVDGHPRDPKAATGKALKPVPAKVWRERCLLAIEEGKKIAKLHDYESIVYVTLDSQIAKDPVIEPVVLPATEDVEARMRRANAVKPAKEQSASGEAYDRLLTRYEDAAGRFEAAGIDARAISENYRPTAVEITTKLRELKEAEERAANEKFDTKSARKVSLSPSSPPIVETPSVVATPPVVKTVEEPATKRGRHPNKIVSAKQLKIVAANKIKNALARPDLTLTTLKRDLDPVWDALDTDGGFEGGEPITNFEKIVWDRLQTKAKDQGFSLDGFSLDSQSGFRIGEGDLGGDDLDDDPPSGGSSATPPATAQDGQDGGEAGAATPGGDKPDKARESYSAPKTLVDQISRAWDHEADTYDLGKLAVLFPKDCTRDHREALMKVIGNLHGLTYESQPKVDEYESEARHDFLIYWRWTAPAHVILWKRGGVLRFPLTPRPEPDDDPKGEPGTTTAQDSPDGEDANSTTPGEPESGTPPETGAKAHADNDGAAPDDDADVIA